MYCYDLDLHVTLTSVCTCEAGFNCLYSINIWIISLQFVNETVITIKGLRITVSHDLIFKSATQQASENGECSNSVSWVFF